MRKEHDIHEFSDTYIEPGLRIARMWKDHISDAQKEALSIDTKQLRIKTGSSKP